MSAPSANPPLPLESTNDPFPNTRWSLVITAQGGEEKQASRALSELFQLYWYPVYGYVRRKGFTSHDAEDLTQAFFEALIRRDSLTSADEAKGKLRAFLLAALKRFLIDHHRIRSAKKRGGGEPAVSIDHESAEFQYGQETADHESPDILFERAWAKTLLKDVIRKLEASYQRANRTALYEALSPHLLHDETPDYRGLAKELGTTVVALRIQYHRMKQRYGELLEQEIRDTVSTQEEADEEREFLLQVLS